MKETAEEINIRREQILKQADPLFVPESLKDILKKSAYVYARPMTDSQKEAVRELKDKITEVKESNKSISRVHVQTKDMLIIYYFDQSISVCVPSTNLYIHSSWVLNDTMFLIAKRDRIENTPDAEIWNYCTYTGTITTMRKKLHLKKFKRYWDRIEKDKKTQFFIIPKLLSGTDATGGIRNFSNYRSFLSRYRGIDGVHDLYGEYSSYGVAIRLDVIDSNKEIKELLYSLEGYETIDEEDQRALETEWQRIAIAYILNGVRKNINLEGCIPFYKEILEDTETLNKYALEGNEECELKWSYTPRSAILMQESINKLQQYIEERIWIEHCEELLLLLSRTWTTKSNEERYRNKLKP